jgi:uncharacterized membrane protein (DUF4010 family)
MLLARVLAVCAVLYTPVAVALAPLLAPQALVGALLITLLTRGGSPAAAREPPDSGSPLRLGAAIKMAAAFQVAIVLLRFASDAWGTVGAYATGAMLGLTDMDALTFSMARQDVGLTPETAARVIAVGVVANGVLKAAIAAALGAGVFRARTVTALLSLAAAGALTLARF